MRNELTINLIYVFIAKQRIYLPETDEVTFRRFWFDRFRKYLSGVFDYRILPSPPVLSVMNGPGDLI